MPDEKLRRIAIADGSPAFRTAAANYVADLPGYVLAGTSEIAITQIHIGLAGGGATADNLFALDNLSVAAPVPEPGTMTLLGLGVASFALIRPRRGVGYQVTAARRSSRVSAPDAGLPKR